jgi:SAM-dependent methyltransferase
MYVRQRARMRKAPAEATGFSTGVFAAVTAMSVIEHGVDLDAFLAEAARLLRPGGLLLLSTDYWPDGVELGGLKRWQAAHGDDIVFDLAGARRLIERAGAHRLELVGDPDLADASALIEEYGFQYTFLFLAFRRIG